MKKVDFKKVVCVTTAVFSGSLLALDTTEPFDVGLSDVETYVAFGGIGLAKGEKAFSSEHVIGAGITEKFSTTLVASFESDEYFSNGAYALGLGLYYNITESEKFGFDLMGSLAFNEGFSLGTELNFYFEKVGLQLTFEESMANNGTNKIGFSTAFSPLLHFNLNEDTQLLTAIDFGIDHTVDDDAFEVGAIGLGLNRVVSDAVEIITEVNYDIPQNDEKGSLGLSVGFIATL